MLLQKVQRYINRLIMLPHTCAAILEQIHELNQNLAPKEIEDKNFPSTSFTTNKSNPMELRGDHVKDAHLYASRIDALRQIGVASRVAEVGVALGDFSQSILEILRPQKFDAFDLFRLHEESSFWGKSSKEWFGDLSHREFYERRFKGEIGQEILSVYEGDSSSALDKMPNQFYDVIYIDGDHSYDGAKKDALVAEKKVKSDGLLIFNDYVMNDHLTGAPYGVVQVVNEFCVERGWGIEYLALQRDMFCDVGLRRRAGE